MEEKNPFENNPQMTIPVGTRADEFERFLIMDSEIKLLHVKNYILVDGDPGNDKMFIVKFEGDNIYMKCIFFQKFKKPEISEGEYDYEADDIEHLIYACDGDHEKLDESFIEASEWEKENVDKREECVEYRRDFIEKLRNWTLLEDLMDSHSIVGIAKIKAFLFYHFQGKTVAENFIEKEIKKLKKNKDVLESDIDELNSIKEKGLINQEEGWDNKYMLNQLRDMATQMGGENGEKFQGEIDDLLSKMS